jgi:hypothetical protein
MKHFKRSLTLLMLVTLIISSRTSAQEASLVQMLESFRPDQINDVLRDNEYTYTGYEKGAFLRNPLLVNGKPLDRFQFTTSSTGELTVIKRAAAKAELVQVPFFIYIRRNGNKVSIPGKENPDLKQIKIDLPEVLKYAEPGDLLIIEAVRKEDGAVKRVLKLLKSGC